MATNNTNTATATAPTKGKGKAAPAPTAAAAPTAAPVTGPTVNGVVLPAPTGPLYTVNKAAPMWGKVNAGSHRAYAQAVFAVVGAALPKGASLNQYKAALVGNVLPAQHPQHNVPAPTNGWAAHNMPTWASRTAQGWLVQVK